MGFMRVTNCKSFSIMQLLHEKRTRTFSSFLLRLPRSGILHKLSIIIFVQVVEILQITIKIVETDAMYMY